MAGLVHHLGVCSCKAKSVDLGDGLLFWPCFRYQRAGALILKAGIPFLVFFSFSSVLKLGNQQSACFLFLLLGGEHSWLQLTVC
jgi:hypothetical protein